MRWRFRIGDADHDVEAVWTEDGAHVTIGDRTVTLGVHPIDGSAFILRDGARRLSAALTGNGLDRQLWVNGRTVRYAVVDTRRRAGAGGAQEDLITSMPGTVRRVLVALGDSVTAGQVLVVLESMKMEMSLTAPHDGTVDSVMVVEGDTVEAGAHLVHVAPHES